MATNNPIDSLDPIQVALGGTGLATATQYGVLYGNGTSNVGVTAVGTSNFVLTSNGAGVSPTFQSASAASGNFVLIQSQTASSSASLTFTTGITASYNTYFFILTNVVPATNTAILNLTVSSNGGSSYASTGYQSGINYWAYNAINPTNSNSTAAFLCTSALSNSAGIGCSGIIYVYNTTSGLDPVVNGQVTFNGSTSGNGAFNTVMGSVTTTTLNAFKLAMSSGNISSGTISLFAILE